MASLIADNGKSGRTWRVQIAVDGVHRTIRIGDHTKADATTVLRHIEALASSRIAGTPLHEQTALWLKSAPDVLRTRLEKAGLCEPRPEAAGVMSINALIESYKTNRYATLKQSTKLVNEQSFQAMRLAPPWNRSNLGGSTKA